MSSRKAGQNSDDRLHRIEGSALVPNERTSEDQDEGTSANAVPLPLLLLLFCEQTVAEWSQEEAQQNRVRATRRESECERERERAREQAVQRIKAAEKRQEMGESKHLSAVRLPAQHTISLARTRL